MTALPLGALLLGGSWIWGYAVALRWVPGWSTGERLAAATVVGFATLQAAFGALILLGWFTRTSVVVLSGSLLVAAGSGGVGAGRLGAAARADAAAARRALGGASVVAKAVGVGVVALGVAMVARSLVAPPLAWDDLTYHLLKAGSWAGAGSWVSTPAPDAWTYYDHFAAGGEVLTSWMLLASPSGGALGLLSLQVWVAAVVAAHAAGRRLGLDDDRAMLAAAAVATVPAVTAFMESAYVDNLVLFAVLAALVGALAVRQAPSAAGILLTSLALGLAAGVKQSMLPVSLIGWTWLLALGWRHRAGVGPARALLGVTGGVAIASPWYLRAWLAAGSPLYPFRVPLLGDLLPANDQLHGLLSGSVAGAMAPEPVGVAEAFRQTIEALADPVEGLNWPPAPVVWLLAATVGAAMLLRERDRREPAALLVASLLTVWGPFLLPDSQTLRTGWGPVLGRLMLPAYACLVLLACSLRWRPVSAALWLVVALQLRASWIVFVESWSELDATALAELSGGLALAVGLGAGAIMVSRISRLPARWTGVAMVVLVVAAMAALSGAANRTRDDLRSDYYEAATRDEVWRVQPLGVGACAWPMWEAVDQPEGRRVAVVAGFAWPTGHNNLRAPFLGSDLQNRIVYVPFTTDGSIIDLAAPGTERQVDEEAWLSRIDAQQVDAVAVLAPEPPELAIITSHPERFRRVAGSVCGPQSALYEVVRGG